MTNFVRWAIVIVAVHAAVVAVHSAAHAALMILPGTAFDAAFIGGVIILAPILAAVLLARRSALGRPLLFLSMFASCGYGAVSHYVLPGPDNVAAVAPDGIGLIFVATTALLAVIEGAGIALGFVLLRNRPANAPEPSY